MVGNGKGSKVKMRSYLAKEWKYVRIWSHAIYSGESVGPSGGSTFDSNQFSHSATGMDMEISFLLYIYVHRLL